VQFVRAAILVHSLSQTRTSTAIVLHLFCVYALADFWYWL